MEATERREPEIRVPLGTNTGWNVQAVEKAAKDLMKEGFLLQEDAGCFISAPEGRDVLKLHARGRPFTHATEDSDVLKSRRTSRR